MRLVMRLVCADCLRSAEVERSDDAPVVAPECCSHCGGPIEVHWDEPSDEYATPLSLALTPEETPPWYDPEVIDNRDQSAARVPDHVGRFQVRELLGGGGFGQVYRAYDPRLDREVALKVLREPHPTARVMERFFREARAAARLNHPNIVALHDAGRDEGRCWIAYQYIEGRTLGRLSQESGPLEYSRAAQLVCTLAEALDHAHRHGVVHRDVKPANVIIDGAGRPCLTDFGLARRLDYDATMTIEGAILGTPAYMSPEQAAGRSHVADARSDVYSLGVMLYELLSGRRPVDLPSGIPAWRAEARAVLPPLRGQGRRIPRALDRICRRALAPQPIDRYPDARNLAEALARWLRRERRGGRVALAAGLAGGLASGVLLSWLVSPSGATVAPRPVTASSQAAAPASAAVRPTVRITIPKAVSASGAVYVVPGSKLFHGAACRSLERVAPDRRREFAEPEEARARGLLPCALCRPAGDGQRTPTSD